MDLIASLVREQGNRLCSRRYLYSQANPASSPFTARTCPGRDWTGRAVYPHDAEDIKAHKWFRDLPWDRLHQIDPPFVPDIRNPEDTHYFDEEEPISDWSESQSESSAGSQGMDEDYPLTPGAASGPTALFDAPPAPPPTPSGPATARATAARRNNSTLKATAMRKELATFPPHVRAMMAHFVSVPYDTVRLKRMDQEMEATVGATGATGATTCARMKAFVRAFGRRERKRPRDRLLRDRKTKRVALEVRKQTAFLGYTYSRLGHHPDPVLALEGWGRDGTPGDDAGAGAGAGASDATTEGRMWRDADEAGDGDENVSMNMNMHGNGGATIRNMFVDMAAASRTWCGLPGSGRLSD